jgi:hypothetical protein
MKSSCIKMNYFRWSASVLTDFLLQCFEEVVLFATKRFNVCGDDESRALSVIPPAMDQCIGSKRDQCTGQPLGISCKDTKRISDARI